MFKLVHVTLEVINIRQDTGLVKVCYNIIYIIAYFVILYIYNIYIFSWSFQLIYFSESLLCLKKVYIFALMCLCCKAFVNFTYRGATVFSFFNTVTLKLRLDSLWLFVYPLFVNFLFSSRPTQTYNSYILSRPISLHRHPTVIQCKMWWQKRGFRWMTPWRLCLPEWAAV